MREMKLVIIATILALSSFGATWYCHSDLGNDAWSGESTDSAKASIGGAIAVSNSGDTILACGRNFNEAIVPAIPLTIDSWPDSGRWKISYNSGYTVEGDIRLHNAVIEGANCVKTTGADSYLQADSMNGSGGYYILYISNTSACTLIDVHTEGNSGTMLFIYNTPNIYLGPGVSICRDASGQTYPMQWSARNIAVEMATPAATESARNRYWKSATLKATWFKP